MTTAPRFVAACLAAAALAWPVGARADSSRAARKSGDTAVYGLAIGLGGGRGMVRPTSQGDAMQLSYLRYTELNGWLARLIYMPARPVLGDVNVRNLGTECQEHANFAANQWQTECVTKTEITPITDEQRADHRRKVAAYEEEADRVARGEVPLELSIDFYTPSLSGNGSGLNIEWLLRFPVPDYHGLGLLELSMGLAWTRVSFADIPRLETRVVDDDTVVVEEVTKTSTFHSAGVPVRVMYMPLERFALYGRIDVNLLDLFARDEDPVDDEGRERRALFGTLAHAGGILWFGFGYLRADAALESADLESLMLTAELGVEL